MLAWLLWQLERTEQIHALAGRLMHEFGVKARVEALQRAQEANSDGTARDWRRVASIIARRTSKRFDLADATRLDLAGSGSADQPASLASERPETFRIEFACGTPDRGATILTEKHIRAADKSAAIIAAANTRWPPQTIGLRILDREGREVFARQKARRG